MRFKICAIGCGGMATTGHGPAYKKYAALNPETELSACCDLSEEKASTFAAKFGFSRTYTDIDTMLKAEKPDAVGLVVPVQLTAPLSIKLMELGYPVILEKPPGLNREETLQMITVADKTGTPNQVSFNRRHMPLIQALKKRLSTEGHPSIHAIQYDFCRIGRTDADFSTTSIHGIDTVRYLVGKNYQAVRFDYQYLPDYPENVSNIFMDCRFADGSSAGIRFYPLSGVVIERADIHAVDHSYFLKLPIWGSADVPGSLTHYIKGQCAENMSGADFAGAEEGFVANGFYGENASFFDAIRMGKVPEDDIASGLQSVEIADCIRRRVKEYRG